MSIRPQTMVNWGKLAKVRASSQDGSWPPHKVPASGLHGLMPERLGTLAHSRAELGSWIDFTVLNRVLRENSGAIWVNLIPSGHCFLDKAQGSLDVRELNGKKGIGKEIQPIFHFPTNYWLLMTQHIYVCVWWENRRSEKRSLIVYLTPMGFLPLVLI